MKRITNHSISPGSIKKKMIMSMKNLDKKSDKSIFHHIKNVLNLSEIE